MQYPIPVWAIRLLAALEEHEDTHPGGDAHWCVKDALDAVPAEVRMYVTAWKAGFDAAKAKSDHLSGGIVLSPAAKVFVDPTFTFEWGEH